MKNKGFTLIELLAVIIILGILMIIAIPSVTKYISDSRKSAYIDTAKEIIGGARNLVNGGKLEMYDTDTTYFIATECIKTENALKSPYGEFVKAYVVVTYDGKGYNYYWTSMDDAGQGIKKIVKIDNLTEDDIESDLTTSDIKDTVAIDDQNYYMIINKERNNCGKGVRETASDYIDSNTGEVDITAVRTISKKPELVDVADAKRFVGENPSNYVWFNEELWRIVGVYGSNLKIVKATPSHGSIQYYTSRGTGIIWENSTLYNTYLIGTYYPTLSDTAKSMIEENSTWYVGRCSDDYNAIESYNCSKSIPFNAKIGLLSTYEFSYASPSECWETAGNTYDQYINGHSSCGTRNWIVKALTENRQKHAWFANSYVSDFWNDPMACSINKNNATMDSIGGKANYFAVSPAVYLKSRVTITEGNGTQSNPYKLSM